MFKSGFVSIVGRPNVGKSTLMNKILRQKIAIMSDVAQTTRNTIQGIYTDDEAQIVFMDTPGIHKPQDGLGTFMNSTALSSIVGVDLVLFLVPADEEIGRGDRYILDRLMLEQAKVILVITKTDKVSSDKLVAKIADWSALADFHEIVPVSSIENKNVDLLVKIIKDNLAEGIKYYPDDQITNHPEKFILAEFIREKVLYFTKEEVPHNVAIVIEKMDSYEDGVDVMATIIVNRKSQKNILIGKQGSMIKKIRLNARREMKRFLGVPVYLELYVKVEKDWRNKPKYLKAFGYDENDY